MRLSREQSGVARGMIAGALASAAAIYGGGWLLAGDAPPPEGRLGWLLAWFALLAAPLAAAIASVARHRFFHASVIDGSNDAADSLLALRRAVLQNTLEQTLLAALLLCALAVLLPTNALSMLSAAIVWFVFARVVFRATYASGAAARSFGFAATFYPSLFGLLVALTLLVLR